MQRHFFRYGLVGALATLAHYAWLMLAVEYLHWQPFAGSGTGAVLGAQVAFLGNRFYTFQHEGDGLAAWAKFQGTALIGALWGMAVVAAGGALGWHYLLSQSLATVTGLVLTFLINRAWTFR